MENVDKEGESEEEYKANRETRIDMLLQIAGTNQYQLNLDTRWSEFPTTSVIKFLEFKNRGSNPSQGLSDCYSCM